MSRVRGLGRWHEPRSRSGGKTHGRALRGAFGGGRGPRPPPGAPSEPGGTLGFPGRRRCRIHRNSYVYVIVPKNLLSTGPSLPLGLRVACLAMHRQANARLAKRGCTADQFVILGLLAREEAVTQQEQVRRADGGRCASLGNAHEWLTWRRILYRFAPLLFQD